MPRAVQFLGSFAIAAAAMGVVLCAASFALIALGDRDAATVAFVSGALAMAVFAYPAARTCLHRMRTAQTAQVRAHIDQHGAPLYERYVALTRPGKVNYEAAQIWRREVAQFRTALARKPWLLRDEAFHELVTQHIAALREKARGWGKRPSLQQPVSIALPRRVEAEFTALGWRAKAVAGPGVLGPVVLAVKGGVRVVLRCEKNVLTRERAERARALRQYYRADVAAIICAGAIADDARAFCNEAGIVLTAPGGARAIYPHARQVWRRRKEKRNAMAAGVRARAQTAGR